MSKFRTIIIGFGPSGIGAALKTKKGIIIEKNSVPGGLSRSYKYKSATYDLGGHSFHTPHEEVKNLIKKNTKIFLQKRNAKCFVKKKIINYPFQKNFKEIGDVKITKECEMGLSNAETKNENYHEFIKTKFGYGISKHFMMPYNLKLWGNNLRRMSTKWTSERIAEVKNQKFDTKGGKRKPLQSDTKVGYPSKNGFGQIFDDLSKKVKLQKKFNKKIKKIDLNKKSILLDNNELYYYSNIVSTISILDLLKCINGVPKRIINLSKKLEYLSLYLVVAIIKGKIKTSIQRIYSSEKKYFPGKVALNHNSSNYLRNTKEHAIMGEISYGKNKKKPIHVKKNFIKFLIDTKIIKNKNEIKKMITHDIQYSYPVPTHEKSFIIKQIKNWLKKYNIYTVGRFAEWDYINSDEALRRGLEIGSKISKK